MPLIADLPGSTRPASVGRSIKRVLAVEAAAAVLCRRWKPAILWLIASGCRRFSHLAPRLPDISPKVLTHQLRQLEREGLVTRHVGTAGRKRVDYTLTPLGEALRPLLDELERWGRQYEEEADERGSSRPSLTA